jgi:LacI family transcriptional regulator
LEINEDYIGIGYYVGESTRTFVPRLVNQGCTAILFSHDVRAISAITECDDRDIRIPEDLSIIGFDDLPMTEFTQPPLTTIRQDRYDLGKSAALMLDGLIRGVALSKMLLRAKFIPRESTKRLDDK